MQGMRLFGQELLDIVKNKKVLISVIGILFIPIMYSGMLVGAFWDPYGKTSELPVAIVNEDTGAELDGKQLALGSELVDNLKDNDKFKWAFVDKEEAEDGVKDGRYYLALEIPSDFSKQATTLMDAEPTPSQLVYVTNESLSFTASKIGSAAITELKTSLSKEVTKSYAETMLEQFGKVADGFAEASDGAGKLSSGASEAKDGAATLQRNLEKLADGTLGLESGVKQVSDGAAQVASGAASLSSSAAELGSGLGQLSEASGQLTAGAEKASDASAKLASGATAAHEAETKLASSAAELAAQLDAFASSAAASGTAAEGGDAAAQQEALQQLVAAAKALAAGADGLATSGGQLAAGASELQQGNSTLLQGLSAFDAKLEGAATGGAKLASGAAQLASGAKQAAAGAAAADAGASELASGSGQLADGSAALTDGVGKLADGSAELADKLSEASNTTSEQVSSDDSSNEKKADMFAGPVEVSEKKLTTVPNYGTGFAPYSLGLGLFVGALLSTIVLPMRDSVGRPRSGGSWFTSKVLLFILVGIIQTLIADAILLYAIGLEVQSLGWFVGLSLVTSLSFMMIIQFFVTLLDQPGRFVSIIILILQLTSSSGTYPKELVPAWLQTIGDWMPMTYAVAGFKAAISSGDFDLVRSSMGTLAIYGVIFAALTLGYFVLKHKQQSRNNGGEGKSQQTPATV
ncbi:putative membrane protein [Paenibacillus cellulosilyticus]|uniref:Putative membrane protein n=1 Tax=Paenibacillus cellulosilyticus TaxID=375489 RepID=A0A2V2YNQ2_9BACL|nr:YhgE/Pip domain-containing protein [Paenibacillus cellulosilyticus]PWV97357.1 putative membrane protein [Paenibacillus cellulosilyticus]QKS47445.1 YhgE/Pip domain-containing protein [Paenibacillus cellulosilyticus]